MVPSYDGEDPFVYVTYCHSDGEDVSFYLYRLVSEGARMSFDERRRDQASSMVAFLSKKAVMDSKVIRDLTFAKQAYMDVTCIYLDDSSFPSFVDIDDSSFKTIRPKDMSLLQSVSLLEANFPPDVFQGPRKRVSQDN